MPGAAGTTGAGCQDELEAWVHRQGLSLEAGPGPPRAMGVGLVLERVDSGAPKEVGCSLHSSSPMGMVSLSALGCWGLGKG